MAVERVRCEVCGQFIGERDFLDALVWAWFQPDTAFTTEKGGYQHKRCRARLEAAGLSDKGETHG